MKRLITLAIAVKSVIYSSVIKFFILAWTVYVKNSEKKLTINFSFQEDIHARDKRVTQV